MRFLVYFLVLIVNFSFAESQFNSPRSTMKTYLKAMVEIKNNKNISENYNQAVSTFDLSQYETTIRNEIGKKFADQLIKVLDKISRVNYDLIPNKTDYKYWSFDSRVVQDQRIEISLHLKDNKWLFTPQTFSSLEVYQSEFANKETVKGIKELTTIQDRIRKNIPDFLKKKTLIFELWQWIGLFLIILMSFILEKVADKIITKILNRNISFINDNTGHHLKRAIKPFGKILFLFIIMNFIGLLDFQTQTHAFIKRALIIAMSIIAVWLGHRIIDLMTYQFTEAAKKTQTKFDDIIIPLLSKTAYVITYIIGAVLIANSLTIDVTGLIAGLGIGGLAFAFAAKDMLANFFGSIMLVLDRPFDIGDVVVIGDIEGVVEEVGFRSTRIRTFYDSMITISNGDLMNKSINNLGKRRYRRLSTTLGLEYDTPPQKIEAFCEAIRQLILSYKWTRKDYFNVYFTNYGASSLDIQVMVFWETDDYTREQAEKHRLNIDILRIAEDMGVNFAFPTQTVHIFNGEQTDKKQIDSNDYFNEGINKAKEVIQKPLSLKNPRSNAKDKNQFGNNDVGF